MSGEFLPDKPDKDTSDDKSAKKKLRNFKISNSGSKYSN